MTPVIRVVTAQPPVLEHVGSRFTVSAWLIAHLASAGVMVPLAGYLADRGYRAFAVAAGLALCTACSVALALCERGPLTDPAGWGSRQSCVLGARVLQGMASGVVLTCTLSLVLVLTHPIYKTRAFGVLLSCVYLGPVIGLPASLQLRLFDQNITMSALCAMASVFSWMVLSHYPASSTTNTSNSWCVCWVLRFLVRQPVVLVYSGLVSAACFQCSLLATVLVTAASTTPELPYINAGAGTLYAAAAAGTYLCVRWLPALSTSGLIVGLLATSSAVCFTLWCYEQPTALFLAVCAPTVAVVSAVVATLGMAEMFSIVENHNEARHELLIRAMLALSCLGYCCGVWAGLLVCAIDSLHQQLLLTNKLLCAVWGAAAVFTAGARCAGCFQGAARLWPLEQPLPRITRGSPVQRKPQLLSLANKWRMSSFKSPTTELTPFAAKIVGC
eukprot:TRINITY_DN5212_c0_g1_i2.p1 TRINITY_DN5212_c0_g1~~TRINITY_DN5212_c0_g1_i2.p1  ORF type:complete len:444 (-),score=45.36 TRINITY_DN5212_c0_g1_i2:215-1546(-)